MKPLLAGPQPYQPYKAKFTNSPTSISNTDVPPWGDIPISSARTYLFPSAQSISRSRSYKSPDPDVSFTRFSQKLGQNVLGTHFVTRGKGCWLCEAGAFDSRVVCWGEVKNGRVRRVVLCCACM